MKILVTGANGFVGKYVVRELLKRNHIVIAGIRNKDHSNNHSLFQIPFNLKNPSQIEKVIKEIHFDAIIHLAAQSKVLTSWEDPLSTLEVNTLATVHLIHCIKQHSSQTKLLIVGSSEEYGRTANNYDKIPETALCQPQNPYATSKCAASQIALQLAKKHHLQIIYTRPFNHFGPGQSQGFVISDFAAQIATIEKQKTNSVLYVGNTDSERDFLDVRDVSKAYVSLVESNVETGIYNICSEQPRKINDILQHLIQLSNQQITVEIDHNKYRPIDVPKFVGNSAKIRKAIGWQPTHDFYSSLDETLAWWRRKID